LSPIRAVILDALGTLVRLEPPAPRLRAAIGRLSGIDVGGEAAARGFAAEIAYYLDHHLEGGDRVGLERLRDDCAAVLHDALGVYDVERAVVRRAMIDALEFSAFPDVRPALTELRARGLRLVVASNWDCSLSTWLDQAGVADLLDGAASSAAAGAPKPEPAVFDVALRIAEVAPTEAVHVGDSPVADVQGASGIGMRAIFLARGAERLNGVTTVRSLAQLPPLL